MSSENDVRPIISSAIDLLVVIAELQQCLCVAEADNAKYQEAFAMQRRLLLDKDVQIAELNAMLSREGSLADAQERLSRAERECDRLSDELGYAVRVMSMMDVQLARATRVRRRLQSQLRRQQEADAWAGQDLDGTAEGQLELEGVAHTSERQAWEREKESLEARLEGAVGKESKAPPEPQATPVRSARNYQHVVNKYFAHSDAANMSGDLYALFLEKDSLFQNDDAGLKGLLNSQWGVTVLFFRPRHTAMISKYPSACILPEHIPEFVVHVAFHLPRLKCIRLFNLPNVSTCVLPWVAKLPRTVTTLDLRGSSHTWEDVAAIKKLCPRLKKKYTVKEYESLKKADIIAASDKNAREGHFILII